MLGINLLRESDGRERHEHRKHRPDEERSLLARDDCYRERIAKLCRGPQCLRRGSPLALLRLQNAGYGVPLAPLLLRPRDGRPPRRGIIRIPGKEVRDTRVIERVIGRQAPDPGKPPDVDGESHGGGVVPATGSRAHGCRG